jgi:hypothetical protein
MPHRLSVRCPACASHATFEYAEIVRIRRKADIPFFKTSRVVEYSLQERRWHGQNWHGAFDAGLRGASTAAIRELPPGYSASDRDHSRYLVRSHGTDRGAVVMRPGSGWAYGLNRRHQLRSTHFVSIHTGRRR